MSTVDDLPFNLELASCPQTYAIELGPRLSKTIMLTENDSDELIQSSYYDAYTVSICSGKLFQYVGNDYETFIPL